MDELKVGTIINQCYRLIQYIGSGSFGEVWMAKDIHENKSVAIKFYMSLDKKGREEFMSEYKVAYGLNHPNLVVTEKYDTWNTRPFLVMKYCAKGASSKAIGNLKPSHDDELFIWRFIHDVAAGLAYLHNQTPDPVVHQDIKPDNVLVDNNDVFLISDFGISKRIRGTMRSQSSRALTAGATAYMGPERFSKNPSPVTASDMWSLGASVYELAEGELPFSGLGGIFLKNGGEMTELSDGWTTKLNDVMKSCLARETWDRIKAFELEEEAAVILANYDQWYASAQKKGVEPSADEARSTRRKIEISDNPFSSSFKEKKVEQKEIRKDQPKVRPVEEPSGLSVEEPSEANGRGKRTFMIAAATVLVVAAVAYFMIRGSAPTAEEMAEKAYVEKYVPLTDICRRNIEKGSQADFKMLVDAKEQLDSLAVLETKYKASLPEKFSQEQALRHSYEEKAKPAAEAWAQSAKTQIVELQNEERALEYYRVAYDLYKTPEVEKAIANLEAKLNK